MEKVNMYEEEQFGVKILIDAVVLCTISPLPKYFILAVVSRLLCITRVPSQTGNVPLYFSTTGLPSKVTVPSSSTQMQPGSERKRNQWITAPTSPSFYETILSQFLRGAQHVPCGSVPQLLMLETSSIIYPFFFFFGSLLISGFILSFLLSASQGYLPNKLSTPNLCLRL